MEATFTLLDLAICLIGIGISSFLLGYTAAETFERLALRATRKREQRLTKWVKDNWPNEYMAYRHGTISGYQAGVMQGPELEDRE